MFGKFLKSARRLERSRTFASSCLINRKFPKWIFSPRTNSPSSWRDIRDIRSHINASISYTCLHKWFKLRPICPFDSSFGKSCREIWTRSKTCAFQHGKSQQNRRASLKTLLIRQHFWWNVTLGVLCFIPRILSDVRSTHRDGPGRMGSPLYLTYSRTLLHTGRKIFDLIFPELGWLRREG